MVGLEFRIFKLYHLLNVDLFLSINLYACVLLRLTKHCACFLLLNTMSNYACWISLCIGDAKAISSFCHGQSLYVNFH